MTSGWLPNENDESLQPASSAPQETQRAAIVRVMAIALPSLARIRATGSTYGQSRQSAQSERRTEMATPRPRWPPTARFGPPTKESAPRGRPPRPLDGRDAWACTPREAMRAPRLHRGLLGAVRRG